MNLADFEQLVRQRKTVKYLAQQALPVSDHSATIRRLLECGGWAPFHKICSVEHRTADPSADSDKLTGIEPWRFHVLSAANCRKLSERVVDLPAAGKIPAMLSAADAMIMATWLPNPPAHEAIATGEAFEPTLGNVEHIAAASAAVQSLLLAATAAGIDNYWSSGGVLRSAEMFEQLGIPAAERLLGAIFLFPRAHAETENMELAESKLRPQRTPLSAWTRWIELSE